MLSPQVALSWRRAWCANIAPCARAPQNLRPHAVDRMRLDRVKKTLQTCSGKHFFLSKKMQ